MRSNYHNIRAIINNVHNYSETIYGATEYTRSLFRANVIKIKNSIEIKLRIKSKPDENVIKIYSAPVDAKLKIQAKLENNNVYVKNSVLNYILSRISPNESIIKIFNSMYIYVTKVFKIKNDIYIDNSFDYSLYENVKVEENVIKIENSEIELLNRMNVQPKENQISIQNPDVNAAAWYFIRLEAMSGGLNAYYNQTISDTGRKKVV